MDKFEDDDLALDAAERLFAMQDDEKDREAVRRTKEAERKAAEEAKRLLTEDVVLGESWAQTEIERYTYRMPGQATAYYYGYNKMQALRTQTELKLRGQFDQSAFHDFILAQGMLPPDILKDAVMNEFVPSQNN